MNSSNVQSFVLFADDTTAYVQNHSTDSAIEILNTECQPVAEVLAHLHVQISPISCNVVGSILHVLGINTDTAIVGYRWTGLGDTTPCTVNRCKKVRGAWLASSYCMGFQNFVVSNKIHPYKKRGKKLNKLALWFDSNKLTLNINETRMIMLSHKKIWLPKMKLSYEMRWCNE